MGTVVRWWLLGCVVLVCGTAVSEEWIVKDPRSLGMGGAGVAVTGDPGAVNRNPAALGLRRGFELRGSFGTSVGVEGDILSTMDGLADDVSGKNDPAGQSLSDKLNVLNDNTSTQAQKASALTDVLSLLTTVSAISGAGQGALGNVCGGVTIAIGHIGISVDGFGYGSVGSFVNTNTVGTAWSLLQGQGNVSTQYAQLLGTNNFTPANGVGDVLPATADGVTLATNVAAILAALDATQGNALTAAEETNIANEIISAAEAGGVNTSDPTIQTIVQDIASGTGSGAQSGVALDDSAGTIIKSLQVYEAKLSYGRSMVIPGLTVGLSLKALQGETHYLRYSLADLQTKEGKDLISDIYKSENKKETTTLDADIGLILSPMEKLSVGLVGRHLMSPKFKFGSAAPDSSMTLDPQLRLGVALQPFKWLTVAVDSDLTTNKSEILSGYNSRQICGGVELKPISLIAFRVGAYENTEGSKSDPVYTAGIGLKLLVLSLDVSAAMSSAEQEIGSGTGGTQKIAERYSIAALLTFSTNF